MIANFSLGVMSEKLRSRVNIYTKMEEMTKVEKEILPKEYGGIVPMADMIGEFIWYFFINGQSSNFFFQMI